MIGTVPPFIVSFQRRFNRTLSAFIAQQKTSAARLDLRLSSFVSLTAGTLANGKRLRPLLVALGYEAAGGKNVRSMVPAGLSVELFHSFALVHDDIMDRATERRGIPTVHSAVAEKTGDTHAGLGSGILAGDLLLALSDQFDRLALPAGRRERARAAFRTMAEETILGQELEFELSRSTDMKLDDIVRAMIYKSGRYSIEWPLTIGAILAGATPKVSARLSSFSIPLGLAFQLRDDILGTFGNPKITGKSRDSDIREGKHTLLAYFAYERANKRERTLLRRVLGDQKATAREVAPVRSLMRSTGALDRAVSLSEELTDAGLAAVRRSGFTPSAVRKLELLARYLLKRDT